MVDEITFDYLLEEYTLPASIVPLAGWNIQDLVTLQNQIDAELQRRYDASVSYGGTTSE